MKIKRIKEMDTSSFPPNRDREFQAVTFDLDGTLYPEYRIFWPSLGLLIRHPRLVYSFSRVRRQIRSVDQIQDFRKKQAELVSAYIKKSPVVTSQLIERIIYGQWLNSIRRMRPYPGIRELIQQLRTAGYKTAVLSDLPIHKKLSYLKLDGIWDVAFSSEETGHLKPHPAAFELLLKKLHVAPDKTIYIGNNYKYDILGARELGIKTGYFSARPVAGNLADFTFTRFTELKHFLLSLLKVQN